MIPLRLPVIGLTLTLSACAHLGEDQARNLNRDRYLASTLAVLSASKTSRVPFGKMIDVEMPADSCQTESGVVKADGQQLTVACVALWGAIAQGGVLEAHDAAGTVVVMVGYGADPSTLLPLMLARGDDGFVLFKPAPRVVGKHQYFHKGQSCCCEVLGDRPAPASHRFWVLPRGASLRREEIVVDYDEVIGDCDPRAPQ